jgi:hypothetical protein
MEIMTAVLMPYVQTLLVLMFADVCANSLETEEHVLVRNLFVITKIVLSNVQRLILVPTAFFPFGQRQEMER